MKIYSYDRGVYGMSIVVANSKEDALRRMRERGLDPLYAPKSEDEIEEHEIAEGLLIENHGDR